MSGFYIMNDYKFSIDVSTTGVEEFAAVAAGITSVEDDSEEETSQDAYLDGDGSKETDVTSFQLKYSFEGHRKYGDKAQDFIFSKAFEVGQGRRTKFKLEKPNGATITGGCTIVDIKDASGEAGSKGECSFGIHFNGKPTITPPTP